MGKQNLYLTIPPEYKERLKADAEKRGISVNKLAIYLIEKYFRGELHD